MMKITKRKILNVLLPVFMFAMAFIIGTKTDVKAGTWDNAADYYNTYGDRCIFSVVNGEPRVYFGSAGTKAVANHTRYRTIGWKVSLYQNGSYQESVYCSLNGSYIRKFPSSNSNGTEYNLYYIDFNKLKSRFSNQAAINSGAGTLYFDAVMSIVPANSNTPNGTINDWGNTTGEVYDTFEGISKARDWGHPDDLRHYYNKSPEGLYRNVYVYKGTGISSVSGGGTYVYGALATISATCSTGYDFNYWSNSSSSSSSFGVNVTSDLSYTAYGKPQTYTISYNANSGTGTMKSDTATYDSPYTTRNNEGFKKTGYTFNGWNTKTDGTGEDWTGRIGKPFNWNYAHDVKLYAQWKPNEYVIVFDKNKPDPENKAQNNKYVLASNDVKGTMNNQPMTYDKNKNLDENKYKLTGWTFTGWNTKADGSGTPYENKASIKNLTSENNATVILYAQWRQNTYTVEYHAKYPTGVNHDSKINGTMPTTDFKYDDPKKALEKNKYTLEGWTFNGWDEYEPKKTSYDDEELVSNLTEKDKGKVIIYTRWKDDTAPDKNETYLQVTDRNGQTVYSDKAYAKDRNKGTLYTYKNDVSVKNVSPWTDSWDTQWLNNPVYINLYSHDKGSGIDRLTVYNLTENGSKYYERTSFTNIYDNVSTIETNNKAFSTNKATKFNGTAADKSGNKTTTRAITVKIDTKAPTGNFIVKTGTLKNPLAGTTSMIYDSNGMVTGVNPEGMRTEITATISDNGNENSVSGVKHVWAVVTDMENVNISKSYKCNRISGDKYNGTYIAVDESGNKPNLYEDFSTSRKLKIKVYACDEAGNISVYKDKEPSNDPNKPTSVTPPSSDPENNIVTNISMWSQIIRDDKEVPDTSYAIGKDGKDKDGHSAEGPAFLLNQSGKVHIVTYGYVEAVDVNFPPALQAAAQTDVAKGQTVKNLGTIANVDGAYVDNRLALSGDCARITDYPFIVPLYLDDTSVKAYETNGDKWLDGITNGIKIPAYIPTANTYMPKKADGTYDIKTVDTVEIPYKGSRTVSGTAVPIEPYNKNECDLRTTASFYCAKDYASKQIISITDKLHTHLVN